MKEVSDKIQEMARKWLVQLSVEEFEEKIKQLTPEQQVLVRNMRDKKKA